MRVIANPKTVGTPKEQRINFQDLYSGNLHEHTRSTLVNKLKDFMRPFVVNLPVIGSYPVRISLELHDTVKNATDNSKDDYGRPFDLDNRSIVYFKCFLDLLVSEGIIIADDRMFVTGVGGVTFHPLPTNDDSEHKLVFTIEQDTRPEIQNHPLYKNFHTIHHAGLKRDRGTSEPW